MRVIFTAVKTAALAAIALKVATKSAEAVDRVWDRYVERK